MRRFIFASHHKLAYGLKETVSFLNNYAEQCMQIYDINAYVKQGDDDITKEVERLFASFDAKDEVIVLTDMMGGSVNQRFLPYISDNVHVITGMNLALAMSLLLYPEQTPFTKAVISNIVIECRTQIIYVNEQSAVIDEEDE